MNGLICDSTFAVTVTKSTFDPSVSGFRGIFMQMRRTGTEQITGTWSVNDQTNFKTVSCQGGSNNAVTHQNNSQKVFLNTFTWNAPLSESADVNVVATYVDQTSIFWVKEIGLTISSSVSGPCNPNPCQNGGSCKQNGNSFTCTCPSPYTGQTCQTATVSPCNSNPCLNGGTCRNINQQSAFMCSCLSGFIGTRCELSASSCNSNPCFNGGTCVDVNQQSAFMCSCFSGFIGTRCELPGENPSTIFIRNKFEYLVLEITDKPF
ncbi:fibropellin-3-like [Lytechinus pictus]|uniref:fibropellin-3-like n=1 Tax=Lytechinus pictus TaxID=7653 RepID=UPI0030BA20AB